MFVTLKLICYLNVMNLIVICHLDVNVMTNELIVVEFMCIFLLKDKAIDKNAWVVDMKVENLKQQRCLVLLALHHPPFPIVLHFDLTYARENFKYEPNYVFSRLKNY